MVNCSSLLNESFRIIINMYFKNIKIFLFFKRLVDGSSGSVHPPILLPVTMLGYKLEIKVFAWNDLTVNNY